MAERSAKVVSISNYGDINLEGNPRPGFPTPSRQLSLAYVVVPRINRTGDEVGAFQARESLRKNLVGKQVTFTIAYTIPTTQREFGQVKLNGQDIAEPMLREGLIKYREESSKREDADKTTLETYQLLDAQARSESKGLWAASPLVIEASQETPDTDSFLKSYKGKKIDAVIEQVRAGDNIRARLLLEPAKHQYLNLLVAGIKCPNLAKTGGDEVTEKGEEYSEEAKSFVETRLTQRFVQVTVLGTNQSGTGYIASIHHPAGNIAEALLSSGLARVVDHQSTLVGEGMSKLRAAESAAKQRRLNIWRSYVPKKVTNSGTSEMTVSKILSADTIFVRNKDGQEKRLQLSSIRGPRNNDAKQSLFAAEAKEFLRKKAIGKHVSVVIDFHKPAADGFDERDVATVTLAGKDNLAKLLVSKGYATVIRHRRDDEDRSPIWDELLAAEETAIAEQKGMHSAKEPATPGRIVEASENATRAKQYLSTLQRSKKVAGVVEFVASGGRFKVFIPRENAKLTLVLSGLKVPRTARNASESSEPMGTEAADYASRKLLQRDVEIEVETTDRVGGFVGSLYVNRENFAVGLLEEGLATVHDYAAEQAGHGTLYREAENRAKDARKGLHANYDPAKEAQEKEEITKTASNGNAPEAPQKREYLDLVVTDVNPATGTFSYQTVGDNVKQLERLMSELQSAYPSSSAATTAPKVGDTVAAKFSEDNAWYRGKVKRVDRGTSKAEVLYYDYGNSELVAFKDLSPLVPKFTALSAQAKEARLSFIDFPQNAEYLEDAVALFQSLCQRQMVASVDRKEGSITYMSLYDPDNEDPSASVNASLIEAGCGTVIPAKRLTWEKAYGTTVTALREKQATAQRRHKGMFEFGDSTGYDD
ncbi:putative Transcription factor [Taphrina deformans PYCC 5710]|uniref:Transcription factor n=1 Tax=Taphrina deformans (strain PYCC 5710 / ATCC 11124 / CBS 356.35 / IMI 108563 / JCM 9778 / NBRC 8474) TaxID=1097556 RepID=R4X8R4_TAPDE|nr:putative Transcription factor [Taphrina deformans PYCC 5710]|eukprot:CCG81790.1 putative Transcription factor [Taphrina deformans PYCC 5710]